MHPARIVRRIADNPVTTGGTVAGIVAAGLAVLVAFHVGLDDSQRQAILALVVVVAPIAASIWARRKVNGPATVRAGQRPLGKLARRWDWRTLQLSHYLDHALTVPAAVDNLSKVKALGMMLNDTLGCCVIAAQGHAVQTWTADGQGLEVTVPDSSILAGYERVGGYRPGDPQTDQGCDMLTALKDWKATGVGNAHHQIGAYAQLSTSKTEIQASIAILGLAYIGIELPLSAQSQVGGVWDVATGPNGKPGSWGGHCVTVAAYDADGLTCITWGQPQKMTWAFYFAYADEAYGIVSADYLAAGVDPAGLNLTQLQADLAAIAAGQDPTPPTPTPGPTPPAGSLTVTFTDAGVIAYIERNRKALDESAYVQHTLATKWKVT